MPRPLLLFALALLAGLAGRPAHAQSAPTNVILFIADGTGPATITMARDYARDQTGRDALALDAYLTGAVRTFATNSRVTDSAAGATAYATGVKTYNGAIGVDTLRRPVGTVLEAAEAAGMATGLIATSRITHATPAAFSAHVPNRGMEEEIAAQQLAQGIDVLFGGGRANYLPADDGGRRRDGRDLLAEAEAAGYRIVASREDFDAGLQAPVLGLFAPDHMAYEIDRDPADEPSLAEMTRAAIDLLDDDPDGFFLMVEASRVDHAGHGNDAAAHVHDALAFDEAFAAAVAYAEEQGGTLVVATSDHEAGGLTLGRAIDGRAFYTWKPEVLARVTSSHGPMVAAIVEDRQSPADVLRTFAGIEDLTEEETALLEGARTDGRQLNFVLADVIARRAVVGWTTGGHTAVDVHLYAAGPGADAFRGTLDNARVGQLVAEQLGLDLTDVTERLRQPDETD